MPRLLAQSPSLLAKPLTSGQNPCARRCWITVAESAIDNRLIKRTEGGDNGAAARSPSGADTLIIYKSPYRDLNERSDHRRLFARPYLFECQNHRFLWNFSKIQVLNSTKK